jgi:predicted  nucleic acid-binding Zn-ribbon protein
MNHLTCTNIGTEYADTDQFICSVCGVHLQDWVQIDEDGDAHEYIFRYCPNCGAEIIEVIE